VLTAVAWTTLTFFEHPIRKLVDPITNETTIIQVIIQIYKIHIFPQQGKLKIIENGKEKSLR